ncbi:hypothetical protein BGZ83_009510 [Gryganskiella cystojenkinii]|nr:hypothetical protein BGZ83_009510 [Gryganskiella cystojenkinii]
MDFPRLRHFRTLVQPWVIRSKILHGNAESMCKSSTIDPLKEFIQRHGHLLQSLTLDTDRNYERLSDTPDAEHSLWSLIMATTTSAIPPTDTTSISTTSTTGRPRHQRLKSLTLNKFLLYREELKGCQGIWEILQNLDSFTIKQLSIASPPSPDHFPAPVSLTPLATPELPQIPTHHPFSPASSTLLDLLSMASTASATAAAQQPSQFWKMTGTKIRHLKLDHGNWTTGPELELIQHCQELISLTWFTSTWGDCPELVSGLQTGSWLNLDCVELGIPTFRDLDFAELIVSMSRPLRQWIVHGSQFGPLGCRALIENQGGRHCQSLEVFSCKDAQYVTGGWLQSVLVQSPKLRSVHAVCIKDEDLLKNPLPWLCTGLRDFRLSLALEQELTTIPQIAGFFQMFINQRPRTIVPNVSVNSKDYQELFRRLGQLRALETLSIGDRACGNVQDPHRSIQREDHFHATAHWKLVWADCPQAPNWKVCSWEEQALEDSQSQSIQSQEMI